MLKKQNGITLVALVITIIVLLILAGITLSMVLGPKDYRKSTRSIKMQQKMLEKMKISNIKMH